MHRRVSFGTKNDVLSKCIMFNMQIDVVNVNKRIWNDEMVCLWRKCLWKCLCMYKLFMIRPEILTHFTRSRKNIKHSPTAKYYWKLTQIKYQIRKLHIYTNPERKYNHKTCVNTYWKEIWCHWSTRHTLIWWYLTQRTRCWTSILFDGDF